MNPSWRAFVGVVAATALSCACVPGRDSADVQATKPDRQLPLGGDPERYCGMAPPGLEPVVFAPGIVSMPDTLEFGIAFSPDASELWFTRRIGEDDQNLYTTRFEGGAWTVAEKVGFTDGYNASLPCASPDGATLYFNWKHPAPPGERGKGFIWAVDRVDGGWSEPRFVGEGMAVAMASDGTAYFTDLVRRNIATVAIDNGRFGAKTSQGGGVETVVSRYGEAAHPAIMPDGSCLAFDVDWERIFACLRQADGSWGPPADLADVGIPAGTGSAAFSPDGKYFFYRYDDDIWWVDARLVLGTAGDAGQVP